MIDIQRRKNNVEGLSAKQWGRPPLTEAPLSVPSFAKLLAGHPVVQAALLFVFCILLWQGWQFYTKKSSNPTSPLSQSSFAIPLGQTLDASFNRKTLSQTVYSAPETIHRSGLNIVFVSDKFESREAFDAAALFIENAFTTIEPWKSYPDFNFFTVYTGDDRVCHLEVANHVHPTLRCSPHTTDLIEPLKLYRFKMIIISRENFTSWANVTRLENSVVALSLPTGTEGQVLPRKVILHEFSHGFGLRDEMTKSVIALSGSEATKPGGPNCAPDVKTALEWWGDLVQKTDAGQYVFGEGNNDVGFFYGCAGNEHYLKPTVGSLMNLQDMTHPSEDYGPVSTRYLSKVLKYCFSDKVYNQSDDQPFFDQYPEFKACL